MLKRRLFRSKLRRSVIVHTKDGKSIRGLLTQEFADGLVLALPEFLNETDPIDLGGELLVHASNISITQVLPVVAEA
jgi:hypothetical protein